jgi:hypothetical protein
VRPNRKNIAIVLVIMVFYVSLAMGQVVLSEIMYDAAGNENYDEFIEVYNLGDCAVDMAGWRISDGTAEDTIISIGDVTLLQVGQYGIILDGDYSENSTYYDSVIPESALKLTINGHTFGSYGLSNSTPETVSLINSNGTVVSSYTYTLGNEPGYSEEKVREELGDDPSNWRDALRWNGTPGFRNSVQPDSLDLALVAMEFEPIFPAPNQTVIVRVKAINSGIDSIGNFTVLFGIDTDNDRKFDPDEEFDRIEYSGLGELDSIWLERPVPELESGLYLIMVRSDFLDDDSTNNFISRTLAVGTEAGSVIFNEIFYKPLSGQCEWVELFNPGQGPVNLARWRFSDSHGISDTTQQMVIPENPLWIDPGGYAMLAEDSTILNFNLPVNTPLYVAGSHWLTLNNSGDSLMLFDATFKAVDSVFYLDDWSKAGDGVSLERINPSHASNDPLNWADCVAAEHATPGRVNSVLYQPPAGEGMLRCEPNPFSPDGDGRDDQLFIRYRLPYATTQMNIKIFDVRGRLVRWLVNNQTVGSAGEVIWDGKHGNGVTARIGMYIVYMEAINAGYGFHKTAKRTVVLAGKL